jgi:hypothetical protein
VIPLHLLVTALFGWLERQQRAVIEFLREENRVLKRQLHGRRLQLCDDERRVLPSSASAWDVECSRR